jgi:hypothetical protein
MTDLDDQLDLLRADLTSRILAPPLPSVVAGSAVPHRRRLSAALVAAALVIAVLTTGALLARSNRHPNTAPAAPHPASSTTQKLAPATPPKPATVSKPAASTQVANWFRSIPSASMADSRHGFALVQTCNADGSTCRNAISVTQDGTHWVGRAAPVNTSNQDTVTGGADAPSLTALGPRTVFFQAAPAGARSGFVSFDAGDTWRPVPPGVNGRVDRIPTGGVLEAMCPTGGSDQCLTIALTVRLPGTGELAKLAHQPDIAVESANAAPLPDGSWWVTGTSGGKPAVAVSRDDGRTWTSTALPDVAGQYLYTSSVTGDGQHLWALAIGQLPDVKNGLLGVYGSTDDGRTWRVVRTAKAGLQPRSALGVAIASGNRVTICDESSPQRGWVSANGAATFKQTVCPAPGFSKWSGSGYLSTDGTTISLSSDGSLWTHSTL